MWRYLGAPVPPVVHARRRGDTRWLPLCREPRRVGRPPRLLVLESGLLTRSMRPASASSPECMRATWNSTRSAGFVAIIRCDTRSYRRADSKDPFDRIEEGDPVYEVWRAGCDGPRAASLATRNAKLNGVALENAAATPGTSTPARASAEKAAATAAPVAKPAPGRGGVRQRTRPGGRRAPGRRLHTVRRHKAHPLSAMPRSPTPASLPSRSRIATRAAVEAPTIARRRHEPNAWTAWVRARHTICRTTGGAATTASHWLRAKA